MEGMTGVEVNIIHTLYNVCNSLMNPPKNCHKEGGGSTRMG
jgi:hypothetical protein